jgi:hypothetical protein
MSVGEAEIFVMTRPNDMSVSSTQRWLVSPPAQVLPNGNEDVWAVQWNLPDPPVNAKWTAVLVISPPSAGPVSNLIVRYSTAYMSLVPIHSTAEFSSALKRYGLEMPFQVGLIAATVDFQDRAKAVPLPGLRACHPSDRCR